MYVKLNLLKKLKFASQKIFVKINPDGATLSVTAQLILATSNAIDLKLGIILYNVCKTKLQLK